MTCMNKGCHRRARKGRPYCGTCAALRRRSPLGRAMSRLCRGEVESVTLMGKTVVVQEKRGGR